MTIISREIGNRLLEGESLYILGIVALSQANPSLAENYYKSALILHKELNQPQYVVEVWAGLAIVHLAQDNLESARKYGQRILDYLDENPSLNGVEYPMRTFAFTWEALNALNQSSNAIHVLTLAANVIQDYLDKNDDPELQAMYLAQPHHKVLWAAWQEQHKTD